MKFIFLITILSISISVSSDEKFNPEAVKKFYSDSRVPGSDLEAVHTSEQVKGITVYLLANDLNKVFEDPSYTAEALIIPTNTELDLHAYFPETQQVLVKNLKNDEAALRKLKTDIEEFKSNSSSKLEPAVGVFSKKIHRTTSLVKTVHLPKYICMVATDEKAGGSINYRDLYNQYRIATGIENCLYALEEMGANSIILPLIGAAAGFMRGKGLENKKEQLLMQCRLENSIAGINLGIANFITNKTGYSSIRYIGIVQWDKDIEALFLNRKRSLAYKNYADFLVHDLMPDTLKGNPVDYQKDKTRKNCSDIFEDDVTKNEESVSILGFLSGLLEFVWP